MYCIYGIYNKEHGKIYIGQCKNLADRLKMRNNKTFSGSYTGKFDGKWLLIHKKEFKTRREAIMQEKQLKSYQGRRFIWQLVSQFN